MIKGLARVVLVTGKGGVGKTTVAAGLARAAVREGRRATLIEFGDGESGKRVLGPRSGVEHKVVTSQKAIQAASDELFGSAIVARAVTGNFAVKRMLRAAPALRELAQLEYVRRVAEERPGALVVVDMPASGHGMAWLRVPERLRDLLKTGPMWKLADRVYRELTSPGSVSVVIVTLPERLVLQETVELCEAMKREVRMDPSRIVINRMPAALSDEAVAAAAAWEKNGGGPDAGELYTFLLHRKEARLEADEAIASATALRIKVPIVLPAAPVDPTLDEVATWLAEERSA